jgi:hypothetical protein
MKAAMKINKQFKNGRYNLWIISAIYMQAIDPKNDRRAVLLPLAERMMEKAKSEKVITDFEGYRK